MLHDEMQQDAGYALRTLRRSPGFTAVVTLTLALGIGATTAIYSVVDAILVQPLPFTDSDRLVRVIENVPSREPGRPPYERGMTHQDFLEWRARSRTLADVVAVMSSRLLVRTNEGTARLWGAAVSDNTFAMLGARAILGRTLQTGDDVDPGVIVLGFDAWRRHFGGDANVVGTTIEAPATESSRRRLLRVVGVLPDGFEFPGGPADFYTPLVLDEISKRWTSITLIGRLRADASRPAALEEANVIGAAIRPLPDGDVPVTTMPRFDVQGLKDRLVVELRPALRVLLATVAVLLLIVCANVANLLLARGTARQREIAVRVAIGASRARVVRQLLTECVVLAVIGGALGAALGAGGLVLVKQLASIEAPGIFRLGFGTSVLPRGHEIGIDVKMFAIAFGVAGLASALFGVLPAMQLSRSDHRAMGTRGGGSSLAESRLRSALVVGQLVMATVLLVSAGLLTHSFVKLSAVDRGYDPSSTLAFQLVFPSDYSIARKTETIETILSRLRTDPSVDAAGFTRAGLLIGEQITLGTFVPSGRTLNEMRALPRRPALRPVSAGYLTAVGAKVIEGRDLAPSDSGLSTPSLVITTTVARQFFGDARAVGQTVEWYLNQPPVAMRVVGVVEDLRNTSPDRAPYPEIFVDYRELLALQQHSGESTLMQNERAIGLLSFAVRSRGTPAAAAPVVERIVRSVDGNAGIDAILPLERLVSSSMARPRFYAVMLGLFAAVAGCLAAIGVYGVLAYAVAQRTPEIGIRMALGAQRAQVLALIMRKGVALTIVGVALGVAGASVGTRWLQSMLFGVTPLDLKTFIAVSLLFGVVATLASYVPARRATKVDPMVALRRE